MSQTAAEKKIEAEAAKAAAEAEAAAEEAADNQYRVVAYVTRTNDKGIERFKKVATFTSPAGHAGTAVGALLQVLGELTVAQRVDISKITIEQIDANAEVNFTFPDA